MELNVDEIITQLRSGKRYVTPSRTHFVQFDGPYQRSHTWDAILERDVEFCREYLHFLEPAEGRRNFLVEAKVGALGIPHLLPTLDFGVEADGRCFFTRPLFKGVGLQRFVESCFKIGAEVAFLKRLIGAPAVAEYGISQASLEAGREARQAYLQELTRNGYLLASTEGQSLDVRSLQLPLREQQQVWMKEKEQRLRRIGGQISKGHMTAQEGDEALREAHDSYFERFYRETLSLNKIDLYRLGYEQQVVVPNVAKLVKVLCMACRAVDSAHQRGILHFHLYPDAILLNGLTDEVYVHEWLGAHVPEFGTPKSPMSAVPRAERDTWVCTPPEWGCSDEETVGPAFDVFALGGILSYILHEVSPARHPERAIRRRFFFGTKGAGCTTVFRGDVDELDAVCLRALAPVPADRWESARTFAEALEGCLA